MGFVEKTLRFTVPFPRERVWPVLSHTDWLNRVLGLPPVSYSSRLMPDGGVTMEAASPLLPGAPIRWREYPFEWVKNESFSERRVYLNGPFREFLARFSIRDDGSGTEVEVSARIDPKGLVGGVMAWLMTRKMAWDFKRVRRKMEEYLNSPAVADLPPCSRQNTEAGRLEEGLDKLMADGWREKLISNLRRFLLEGCDAEVVKIRAFRLADVWKEDRWEVLRLFLHATRAGLVDLSWEVLCPSCRGDRTPRASLSELSGQVHCPTCQITFDSEFDQSVELKFAINPSLRAVEREIYCIGGPGQQSNLEAQVVLEPGQSRTWTFATLSGRYRLRSPQVAAQATIVHVTREAGPPVNLDVESQGWKPLPPSEVSAQAGIRVNNRLDQSSTLLLERADWNRDVATAALVTNWQEFRDLFSREVLSPGEEITVGRQVLLFTDLRGSTALYQKIGDAPAYSRVREHFRVIERILSDHHGGLVKTIGDAIMATFSGIPEALNAVIRMHREVSLLRPEGSAEGGLLLKAGLHIGPCIAVNANDRLDYFGSSVNLAARLTGLCGDREIILSDEFYRTQDADRFLKKNLLQTEAFTAQLRGFDGSRTVWRVRLASETAI